MPSGPFPSPPTREMLRRMPGVRIGRVDAAFAAVLGTGGTVAKAVPVAA